MSSVAGIRAGPSLGASGGPRQRAGAFELSPESAPAGGTEAAMAVGAPAALAGALVLQELGCEGVQDRAARRRGYDLLAALRALQRGLLADCIDAGSLSELARLSIAVPEAADPRLREVMSDLVLRARVELARHEK